MVRVSTGLPGRTREEGVLFFLLFFTSSSSELREGRPVLCACVNVQVNLSAVVVVCWDGGVPAPLGRLGFKVVV